jgi:hypothetical protein
MAFWDIVSNARVAISNRAIESMLVRKVSPEIQLASSDLALCCFDLRLLYPYLPSARRQEKLVANLRKCGFEDKNCSAVGLHGSGHVGSLRVVCF